MTGRSPLQIAAFGYHDVVDRPGESGFQRRGAVAYKLSRDRFAAHLDHLAAAAPQPGVIRDVARTRSGRHLLLTFDDGGSSAMYVGDALSRRGWRGHFFVTTGLLGQRGFLDPLQVRQLRQAGHLIGTHSHTHPDIFRALSVDRMREEWRVSRAILEDLLGEPCEAGSVPGGDVSRTVLRTAADSGLRWLFTSDPLIEPREVNGCLVIGRYVPKAGTDAHRIAELASFRGWGRALMVRKLKGVVRRALPYPYRLYVGWQTKTRSLPAGGAGTP